MVSASPQLPIVLLACKVFQHLLEEHFPKNSVRSIEFLDYGLHAIPKKLTMAVQEKIDGIKEASLVVLGYGLCGNGLDGIKAGKHTLLIPRTDDCIAILLGSYQTYRQKFHENPATYYLTKGWLESGSNPLDERNAYEAKYGPETADWLMDEQYRHYKRLVLVAHDQADLEKYRPKALEVARYCERWGMKYEEILCAEHYVQRLAEVAQTRDKIDDEFILIPPGGELQQGQFMR